MKVIGTKEFQEVTKGMDKDEMIKFLQDSKDCPKYWGLTTNCTVSCDVCIEESVMGAFKDEVASEVEVIPAYKGSQIVAMIESGQLQLNEFILDKDGIEYVVNEILMENILTMSPFTIREKDKEIPFLEAIQAYENGEIIYSNCNEITYEYIPNINLWKQIKDNEGNVVSSKEILEGRWYIKS